MIASAPLYFNRSSRRWVFNLFKNNQAQWNGWILKIQSFIQIFLSILQMIYSILIKLIFRLSRTGKKMKTIPNNRRHETQTPTFLDMDESRRERERGGNWLEAGDVKVLRAVNQSLKALMWMNYEVIWMMVVRWLATCWWIKMEVVLCWWLRWRSSSETC